MEDAYDVAQSFLDRDAAVTCIPVRTRTGQRDVAVVALEPNIICRAALEHDREEIRMRGRIAIAVQSHKLLKSKGLTFACHTST